MTSPSTGGVSSEEEERTHSNNYNIITITVTVTAAEACECCSRAGSLISDMYFEAHYMYVW